MINANKELIFAISQRLFENGSMLSQQIKKVIDKVLLQKEIYLTSDLENLERMSIEGINYIIRSCHHSKLIKDTLKESHLEGEVLSAILKNHESVYKDMNILVEYCNSIREHASKEGYIINEKEICLN